MAMKRIWKQSLALTLALSTAFTGIPVHAETADAGSESGTKDEVKAAFYWDFESGEAGSGAELVGAATVEDGTGRDSKVLKLAGGKTHGDGHLKLPEKLFSGVGEDGFTVSMWIKPTEANDNYARVFEASTKEFGTHGDDWWSTWPEIAVAVGKGDWDTEIHAGANAEGKAVKNAQAKINASGSYLGADEWKYLTLSISPDSYKVYVDGAVLETVWDTDTNKQSDMQAALEELFKDNFQQTLKYAAIGSSTYTGAKELTGEIDNVSFFNTALTAEQTKALYDADGVAQVEITDPGETDPGETDPGETDPGKTDPGESKFAETPVYSFDFEDGTAGKGTFEGKASVKEDYNKGKVLSLEGGSMTLPQDLFSKLGTDGFTISMWVKADSDTGNYTKVFDASNAPLGKSYSGHNWSEPDFAFAAGGDVYDMTLYVGDPQTECASKTKLKYDEHISRTKWQHMVVSISPDDYKIYFDGKEVSYADAQGSTQAVKTVLPKLFADNYLASLKYASIGKSYYTSDANFKGLVDDINFYAKALSADETAALYKSYGEIKNETEPITMSIDMDKDNMTGDIKHGATGFLYGIGEDNVPDVNLMTAIKPYMCEQKPPEGLQHPNGDILVMADTFIEAGGDSIQIACPDIYADWPYEIEKTEDGKNDYTKYAEKLKVMAQQIKDAGLSDKAVYVIYNEPEGNWFGSIWSGNMDEFNNAWKLAYDAVKSVDPDAKIAGPNFAVYHGSQLEKYMKFCAENDCIPYQMTWHVLGDPQYVTFHDDVAEFRGFEKKYWIDPKLTTGEMEIVVNEYADFTQLGVPGQLARWIALFEDEKATACLAYWHISNNLCDLAASNNEPNGAWWLFKWYAEMSGETLNITTSGAPHTQFYGVASMDENKKSAMAVFGGANGTVPVTLTNVNKSGIFGKKVNVKIESTSWTGINGAAEAPVFVKEAVYPVDENGNVVVEMTDMVAASAYRFTITQAEDDAAEGIISEGAWRKTYEGEDAVLAGSAKNAGKNGMYACSGTGQVQGMNGTGDSATFNVDVPEAGWYRFDMVYGAATGNNTGDTAANDPKNAIQTLTVNDGEPVSMYLENTLHWYMSGQHTEYIKLNKGENSLKVAATGSKGKASIDCMYLTYVGDDAALDQERYVKTYEAELSDYNVLGEQTATTVTTASDIKGYSGAGYATGLNTSVEDGGGIRFTTFAKENGMYDMTIRYAASEGATLDYYVNNTNLTLNNKVGSLNLTATDGKWNEAKTTFFLKKGINIIDLDASSAQVAVDTLTIRQAIEKKATTVIEAEDCKSVGSVSVGANEVASNGKYVKGILADKDAKNALLVEYTAPEAGTYEFAVYQSNKELFGNHVYNAQMVDRFITISVNDGEPQNVYFRNTYSDDSFRSQVVTLNLKKGVNTIKIYNSDYRVHKNEHSGVNECTNYTPNLDKFEISPAVYDGDYSALNTEITKALNVNKEFYTEDSCKALEKALENALKDGAGEAETKALQDALGALVLKEADVAQLKTTIADADAKVKEIRKEHYTPQSYQTLTEALAAAKKLGEDATADVVAGAIRELQSAMEGLTKNPWIVKAENLDPKDYTEDTYKAVKEKLDIVLNPGDGVNVKNAITDLRNAIEKLKAVERAAADYTALNAAIARAKVLDANAYTEESYQKVKEALAAAKKLTDAKDDQQAEVDAAAKALNDAIDALVKKPANDPKDDNKPDNNNNNNNSNNNSNNNTNNNTAAPDNKKPLPAKGAVYTVGKAVYQVNVSDETNGTVTFVKPFKKTYTSITVPATVDIEGYTFRVTAIKDKACYKNTSLKTVKIGSNVETIEKRAFEGCKKLTKVTIGDKVTKISDKAFKKCTSLKKIVIPSKVTTIGKSAFEGDSKLQTITIKGNKLKSVGSKALRGIHKKSKITVPAKKYTAYKKLLKKKGQKSTVTIKKSK